MSLENAERAYDTVLEDLNNIRNRRREVLPQLTEQVKAADPFILRTFTSSVQFHQMKESLRAYAQANEIGDRGDIAFRDRIARMKQAAEQLAKDSNAYLVFKGGEGRNPNERRRVAAATAVHSFAIEQLRTLTQLEGHIEDVEFEEQQLLREEQEANREVEPEAVYEPELQEPEAEQPALNIQKERKDTMPKPGEVNENQNPLEDVKTNVKAYLIPESAEQRETELTETLAILSDASTNIDNVPNLKKDIQKVLEDYDRVLKEGRNWKREEFDGLYEDLYHVYYRIQMDDSDKLIVDGEYQEDIPRADAEFPRENRGPADFVYNFQKVWAFLKYASKVAPATNEAYTTDLLPGFMEVFAPAYRTVENPALEEVQNVYQAAENRRYQAENQSKVDEMFGKLEEYLLPETEEQQHQELEQMSDIIRQSAIDAGSGDRERFLNDFRGILKEYNELKKKKDQPVDYKKLYTDLYNKIYYRMQLDDGTLQEQFPENTRNAENFEMNVQKAWVFLKGYTNMAKEDRKILSNVATYSGYFKENKFEEPYKKGVQAAKLAKLTKLVNTYKEAKDKLVKEAREAARDSNDDVRSKYAAFYAMLDWTKPYTTQQRLKKIDEVIELWADHMNKLSDKRAEMKKFLEHQAQLAAKGILKEKDLEADKNELEETDERLQHALNTWQEEIGAEALNTKRQLSYEVNELENAMISFEAAAAESLGAIRSGHADAFRSISEAVAAYKNMTPETEGQCAENLYKACREYLNAHTRDGIAQEEIGGQGTQTGRVRKAAVVKLLEIMEQRADDRRPEFSNARAHYHRYFQEKNHILCPELDFDILKTSLAEHSKADLGRTQAKGAELRDLKAYAELDKVREGYLKKQNDAQKKQAEAEKKHRREVKVPKR